MEFLENYKVVLKLRKFFSSKYLPIISAAVVLACYYLALEVVAIWYFCLCGVGIMLTCRDVTPIFSIFLLMGLFISVEHSPSILVDNPSDYFTRPVVLVQMIIAISLLIGMAVFRTWESIVHRRFKITPLFVGLCLFVTVLLLNGVFSEYYTVMDIVYALFLALLFLGIFCFACGNMQVNEDTFDNIAFSFIVLLAVLTIELIVAYATYDGLIVDGVIMRDRLSFGWGTYNNFGMYATLCIPSSFYLAGKYKHGWAFVLCSVLNLAVVFFCMSRQAILMGSILFVACAIWLLIRTKGRTRLFDALILAVFALVVLIISAVRYEEIGRMFYSLGGSLETGSSRTIIWKEAMDKFLNYPLFGGGFFSRTRWVWGQSGFADIIPRMYHNTVIQLLECSGLLGFGAYAVHRVQTVLSFFANVTHGRVLIAFTIGALVLVSLLDNHIFYLFPTIIYSMLVGVLALSEQKVTVKRAVLNERDDVKIHAV